jgi:hypothetical protein
MPRLLVTVRTLAASLLVLLALAGPAHAMITYSAEGVSGVGTNGVSSLHAHLDSTSSLTYTARFNLGTTTAYGTNVAGSTGANNVPPFFFGTIVSVPVTGLSCGTTYHWRLDVLAAATGNDQTFTTSACVSVSPSSKDYGTIANGSVVSQAFTISNHAASSITVSAISFSGTDAALFSVSAGTCGSVTPTIAASGSCTVNVAFAPLTAGGKSATMTVASSAPDSPTTVALAGTGTGAAVPTVSQWGMLVLGVLFVGALLVASRRGAGRAV